MNDRYTLKISMEPADERLDDSSGAVVGLFAGIGGFELGFHLANFRTSLLCEIEQGAQAVLRARFPGVSIEPDVTQIAELPSDTDVVLAGFPCQDLSQAGQTRGIEGSQSSLVGHVFRLLRTRRVPWVVLENVPFMLQLARGRALDAIVTALEDLGYRWAYRVVDTMAFGLPQRRRRVFFVASLLSDPRDVLLADEAAPSRRRTGNKDVACGFYWTEGLRGLGWAEDAVPTLKGGSTIGIPSPPAILLPNGQVVKPDIRDAERLQGFPADWTKPAEEVGRSGYRWKLVGNAVTVDVARWIGSRLKTPGRYREKLDLPFAPGAAWPEAAWNLGDGRFESPVADWPLHVSRPSLVTFLHHRPAALSAKAVSGFLSRTRRSTLRFPEGFIDSLNTYLGTISHSGEAVPESRIPATG